MKIHENKCPLCGGTDLKADGAGLWIDSELYRVCLEIDCENCGDSFEAVFIFQRFEKDDVPLSVFRGKKL
jgi:hypothetical protein